MKKLIFVLTILIINVSVNAQDKVMKFSKPLHLSFGLDAGAPLGKYSKTSAFVIGGDLQVGYNITQNFSATASAGIDARLNKGGVVNTVYYVPLLAGLKFYLGSKVYISEQAGYSPSLTKGVEGVFTNVPGIGFKLGQNSDILIAYKTLFNKGTVPDFNTLAFRIAYNFGK